jgi:hypothetical protein
MLRKPGHFINDGLGRCKDTMTLDKVIHQSCHDCSRSDQRESFKVDCYVRLHIIRQIHWHLKSIHIDQAQLILHFLKKCGFEEYHPV